MKQGGIMTKKYGNMAVPTIFEDCKKYKIKKQDTWLEEFGKEKDGV